MQSTLQLHANIEPCNIQLDGAVVGSSYVDLFVICLSEVPVAVEVCDLTDGKPMDIFSSFTVSSTKQSLHLDLNSESGLNKGSEDSFVETPS